MLQNTFQYCLGMENITLFPNSSDYPPVEIMQFQKNIAVT